jgi:hypothetical protein
MPTINNPMPTINNPMPTINNPNITPSMMTLNEKLKKISEIKQLKELKESKTTNYVPKNSKYLKRKKTLRRTYKVGKSKVHPKVSVLISNKTIRKDINTKSQLLKQVPMNEIKKFLINEGFIKVGSTAPNDVLRKTYESIIMTGGKVKNHNMDNILYNYLNSK